MADNERHLRSLEFIHDARILISPIPTENDSIDVVTKDIFEIIAELNNLNLQHFKAKIGDVNVLGTGQKVSFTALFQKERNPNFGYEIYYSKNNIANTFINATCRAHQPIKTGQNSSSSDKGCMGQLVDSII